MTTPEEERALAELQRSLLSDQPKTWPEDGDEAFRQHKILASAIHRTTRLDKAASKSDTAAWVRYFEDNFPAGRNDPNDARVLFGSWRCDLLKDDNPGSVKITHGQSHLHWVKDKNDGRLVLNLEDMWHDFAGSVGRFIAALRQDPERRGAVLKRWQERSWTVVQVKTDSGTVSTASVATSVGATAMSGPPRQ